MSDKVTNFTPATSVASTDTLYLVQSSTDKSLSIATLFADVPVTTSHSGRLAVTGTHTLNGAGEISVSTNITLITNPDASGNLTIGSGITGQIKIITMTSNNGGHTLSLQDSQLAHAQIDFSSAGHTATLIYINDRWYMIGGTATVSV